MSIVMSEVPYLSSVAALLVAFSWCVVARPRQGILAALVLTTFGLTAIPWHVLGVDGVGVGAQVGVWLLVACWFALRTRPERATPYILSRYTLALTALGVLIAAYLLVSDNPPYALSKTVWFFVKGVAPLIAFGMLAPYDREDIHVIAWASVAAGLLTATNLLAYGDLAAERTIISDGNPINVARPIGMAAALVLTYLGLEGHKSMAKASLCSCALALLLFGILLTGSRGPLVAALVAALGTVLLACPTWKHRLRWAAVGVVGLGLLLAVGARQPIASPYGGVRRVADRFSTLGSNRSDRSRIARLRVAWDGFVDSSGTGIGTGDYAVLYEGDAREYPHNVLFEVAVEQGVPGLAALAVVLAMPMASWVRLVRSTHVEAGSKAVASLWAYALLNALISMDIAGNSALWVMGWITWSLSRDLGAPSPEATDTGSEDDFGNDLSPSQASSS